MRRILVLGLFVLGCSRAEGTPPHDAPRGTGKKVTETSQKAPTSPEIIERAERILAEHGDAPVGTEIPFTLNGRRYVARVEIHENSAGSPDRPPGDHKGVTVYLAPP